jgi:hypothetical protein
MTAGPPTNPLYSVALTREREFLTTTWEVFCVRAGSYGTWLA